MGHVQHAARVLLYPETQRVTIRHLKPVQAFWPYKELRGARASPVIKLCLFTWDAYSTANSGRCGNKGKAQECPPLRGLLSAAPSLTACEGFVCQQLSPQWLPPCLPPRHTALTNASVEEREKQGGGCDTADVLRAPRKASFLRAESHEKGRGPLDRSSPIKRRRG